jgi:hypothetical protein
MGGSQLELLEYSHQDYYLTGQPQMSFFKFYYKRYTNFAIESIKQKIVGNNISFDDTFKVTISKVGDLISKCYIHCKLNLGIVSQFYYLSGDGLTEFTVSKDYKPYVHELGHRLIESVELKIGGNTIDKHYSKWLSIWNSLILPEEKINGYNKMIGNVEELTGFKYKDDFRRPANSSISLLKNEYNLTIPLQFWFCRHYGLSLPINALQYNEVEFIIKLSSLNNIIVGKNTDFFLTLPTLENVEFYTDYIYLDIDEKKRFVTSSHEYLIEYIQKNTFSNICYPNITLNLNFKNLVKELIWILYTNKRSHDLDFSMGIRAWGNPHFPPLPYLFDEILTTMYTESPIENAMIKLNNKEIINENEKYFSVLQPYQHHTSIPSKAGIFTYSFALNPEYPNPTGTCNFSNIKNKQLILKLKKSLHINYLNGHQGLNEEDIDVSCEVYALTYNVLKISNGIANLSFSN